MYKKYLLSSFSSVLLCSVASAVTVDCRPGQLASLIDNPAQVSELTLTGSANAADFRFIELSMPELRTLDLSQCTVAAYSGDAILGVSEFPAATIPQIIFAGAPFTSISLPATEPLSIAAHAFTGSALTSVTIPANVTEIGGSAFAGSKNLKSVTLTKAAAGEYAFSECTALENVNFGSTTSVGTNAFAGCTSLSVLEGTDGISNIGNQAFTNCTALEKFDFGTSLQSVGDNAFAYSGLTEALLEDTKLTTVGNWAFAHCASLAEASLPKTLTTAGEGIFFDCPKLSSLVLSEGMTALPDYALKGDATLAQINLPSNLTSVGAYAMKDASEVSKLTLPSTLEYIGDYAMEGMTGLAEIDANALSAVPELGCEVWDGVNQDNVVLNVPEAIADIFKTTEQWEEFDIRSIPTSADNPQIDIAGERSLRGRFEGTLLVLDASGTAIANVYLFDAAGRLLATAAPAASRTTIDTASLNTEIFIVRCRLSDGSESTLKMAR